MSDSIENFGLNQSQVDLPITSKDEIKGDHISVAALYYPDTSTIYISEKNPERILDPRVRESTQNIFLQAGKPEKYLQFLYTGMLAGEFCHFVQHTRGEISKIHIPALTAENDELFIHTFGVDMNELKKEWIMQIMQKVFKVMNYVGNPPRELVLQDGEIFIEKDELDKESAQYYESIHDGTHYGKKLLHKNRNVRLRKNRNVRF